MDPIKRVYYVFSSLAAIGITIDVVTQNYCTLPIVCTTISILGKVVATLGGAGLGASLALLANRNPKFR